MTPRDLEAIRRLTPRADPLYRAAFDLYPDVLPRFGIRTPQRWFHFLAQVLHETNGLTVLVENLHYTTPERLMAVWPSRFRTRESALPYVKNARALANKVYNGRLGNRDAEDGWSFRGHGLLQLTGRDNYQRVDDVLAIGLVYRPELALASGSCLAVAACIWHLNNCNVAADTGDVGIVTRAVNGGQVGLADRRLWFDRVSTALAA